MGGDDIWERADEADRLRFALLAEPGPEFDPASGSEDEDPHEIHHMLMAAVSEPLRRTLADGEPFDHELYVVQLAELPGSLAALRQT